MQNRVLLPMLLRAFTVSIAATGLIAALLAPHTSLFWGNFALFWLPTVATIAIAALCRAGPPSLYGVAGATAAILLAYQAWVLTMPARDSALAWAGYLLCMPSAVVGAIAGVVWTKFRPLSAAAAALAAFSATGLGFAVGLAVFLQL